MYHRRGVWGALLVFLLISSVSASADPLQRHVLDTSINLGWVSGVLDHEGRTDGNIAYLAHTMNNAAAHVHAIWPSLRPPHANVDLADVYDRIVNWNSRTYGWTGSQVSYYYTVPLFNDFRRVWGTTCEGYFADVGFHFARANIAAITGNTAALSFHLDVMRQAIRAGLQHAGATGCAFGSTSLWDALSILSGDLSADSFATTREQLQSIAWGDAPPSPDPSLWEGKWVSTTFGEMNLQVSGSTFTGTLGLDNGRLWGTVHGRVLEGNWVSDSFPHGGRIRLELNADNRSFTGQRYHAIDASRCDEWGGIRWWLP